jgi:glc operon protein GlcG
MSLTEAQTLAMLTAALDRARELGVQVGISVVDADGHLVAGLRMGAVKFPWVLDAAEGKALATVTWGGRPSADLADGWDSQIRQWVSGPRDRRPLYLKGALPVRVADELVGAIGASGASAEEDEDIARAGVAALAECRPA